MSTNKKIGNVYGFLWDNIHKGTAPLRWHFNAMQEVIDEPIVRGKIGIDIGSGCGYDTYIMAKHYPGTRIVSVDISDGIYATQKLTAGLGNVTTIKCSVLEFPIKNNFFDFAYSFGVLHHTPDPLKGLSEISRTLKKDSPIFLYLYEDHSQNFIKRFAIKIISKIRKITTKLPSKILYLLSWIASPFIFLIFSFPAKILERFKTTEKAVQKIPFNFGTSLFSLQDDLYDRFSAPVEYRYNKKSIYDMFMEKGFYKINITNLNGISGWVAWGYKK